MISYCSPLFNIIINLVAYKLVAYKKNRRISVGPFATFYFESYKYDKNNIKSFENGEVLITKDWSCPSIKLGILNTNIYDIYDCTSFSSYKCLVWAIL